MKIICVTGKSGSGKTTFSSILSQKINCKHIDIDKICHEALLHPEIKQKLCDEFGLEILDKDGTLNRKKIGNIVFSNKDKMNILTNLSWNYMEKAIDKILLQNDKFIVLDAILLPYVKYWNMCYLKILIESDDIMRKNKVINRDHISEDYFDKRDSSSINYSSYKFDYIFENNYDTQSMNKIIDNFLEKELKLEQK